MNTFGLRVVTLGGGETVFLYGPMTTSINEALSTTISDDPLSISVDFSVKVAALESTLSLNISETFSAEIMCNT